MPLRSVDRLDLTKVPASELRRVLRHLNRHTVRGRERAATNPSTKTYLQAGVQLIKQQFEPVGQDDDDPQPSPFFAWVSRRLVVDEIPRLAHKVGLAKTGSVNGLRDRWEPHRNYIADLLALILASDHWSLAVARDEDLLRSALDGDLAAAAHEFAFSDLEELTSAALSFRVQMIATSYAERDESVREALKELYEVVTQNWARVYEAIISALDAKLRNGITLDNFTDMLTAAAEGLAMRLLADPEADVIDRDKRESLLGTVALGLIFACIDFSDDGRTLEDAVRAAVDAKRSGSLGAT